MTIKEKVKRILIANEVDGNESDVYRLTLCKGGVSGYSFGWQQMDIAVDTQNMDKLINILTKGRCSQATIDKIKSVAKKPGETLNAKDINEVNAVLQVSKAAIDELFDKAVDEYIKYVDSILKLNTTKGTTKEQLLNRDFVFCFLVDYHNQFYISIKGSMVKLLSAIPLDTKGVIGTMLKYYFKTKYATGSKAQLKDLIRRFTNVIRINLDEFVITSNEADEVKELSLTVPETNNLATLMLSSYLKKRLNTNG